MVQFNLNERVMTWKVVYYGPALSGKTTNLMALHAISSPRCRGRLVTLETRDDRTIYFDMLPMVMRSASGFRVKIKLYTVPGQVIHNTTRRVVLKGADGVVFVADSQYSEARNNTESWYNLRENLEANNHNIDSMPLVIQFNKRDLPHIISSEELEKVRRRSRVPAYPAIAVQARGVVATMKGLLTLMWSQLDQKHHFQQRLGLSEIEFMSNIKQMFAHRTNPKLRRG